MAEGADTITYEDFAKLDIRVARVLEVSDHPNADKLILLQIDLGPLGQRQLVAGLKPYYPDPQVLVGKDIVVVANLAPRTMRGQTSYGMLLAGSSDDRKRVVILTSDEPVEPGSKVS